MNSSSEYADASVSVNLDGVNLPELVGHIQDWCEELVLLQEVESRHLHLLGRLSHLKSLTIDLGGWDDEALLQISKLLSLKKLKLQLFVEGRVTVQGWLLFARRLTQLEHLDLPFPLLPGPVDFDKEKQLKQEIARRMPQASVK